MNIGFLGSESVCVARFVSAIIDRSYRIMVFDASYNKRLFFGTIGRNDIDVAYYHNVMYTTSLLVVERKKINYDILLIYDDFASNINYKHYKYMLDYNYIFCGVDRFSTLQYVYILDSLSKESVKIPYSVVATCQQEMAMHRNLESLWHMCRMNYSSLENVYYVPSNIQDTQQFHSLDYGCLDVNELSLPMQTLLEDIIKKRVNLQDCSLKQKYKIYGV